MNKWCLTCLYSVIIGRTLSFDCPHPLLPTMIHIHHQIFPFNGEIEELLTFWVQNLNSHLSSLSSFISQALFTTNIKKIIQDNSIQNCALSLYIIFMSSTIRKNFWIKINFFHIFLCSFLIAHFAPDIEKQLEGIDLKLDNPQAFAQF